MTSSPAPATSPADTTVLITGASGFIAQHTILAVLAAGYRVRGTVRSLARSGEIRKVLAAHAPLDDRFELVEAELTSDAGWREACRGCRFIPGSGSCTPFRRGGRRTRGGGAKRDAA